MVRELSRYVLRENVRRRFAPLEGSPGRSVYRDAAARFDTPEEAVTVRPPFGLAHEAEYDVLRVSPLLGELARDRLVGVLLVRLGGYAIGVFSGTELLASKVGTRYVHGRHRAGGSSANRFRRRRDEQAKALVEKAAETAVRVLQPYLRELDALALGGDRFALLRTVAERRELAALEPRTLSRVLVVPDPRRDVLERAIHDVYAAEVSSG